MERLRIRAIASEDICTRRHTISRGATRFHTTAQITSGSNNDSVILVGWFLEKRLGGRASQLRFSFSRAGPSAAARNRLTSSGANSLNAPASSLPSRRVRWRRASTGRRDGGDGVTHLAHLTVAPFTDRDLEKGAGVTIAPAGVHGGGRARGTRRSIARSSRAWRGGPVRFEDCRDSTFDLCRIGAPAVDHQSACEPGEVVRVGDAEHARLVAHRATPWRGCVSRAARSPSLVNSSSPSESKSRRPTG